MKKMLISGAYGTGNLGDEYILLQLINIFQKKYSITVLSQHPEYTAVHFPTIRTVPQSPSFLLKAIIRDVLYLKIKELKKRLDFIKEVVTCDVFLLGGGGLLVEMIPRVLRYYILQLTLAKILRRQVIIFGVGVGVLKTENGKKKLSKILHKIPYIYVRDESSLNSLKNLGVNHVKQMPDLVYGLYSGILEQTNSTTVGVNVYRPFVQGTVENDGESRLENFEHTLGEVLSELVKRGKKIEFFSFGSIYDDQYAQDLQNRWKHLNASFKHFECKEDIVNYGSTITMRFHAGVTSLMYGIPSLCIDGQYKSERLLKEMDLLKLVVPLTDGINRPGKRDIHSSDLIEQFNWIDENRQKIRSKCESYFSRQKEILSTIEDEVSSFL